jgi:adenine-specific DNA-methyltransferase
VNFIANESARKLRGGYYTPLDLATFLAKWINEKEPKVVLEPSCGDGVFFEALARVGNRKLKVVGYELDSKEAAKASLRAAQLGIQTSIELEDFLGAALSRFDQPARFDAVLGNPPFVRYQYLPEQFQHRAEEIFRRLELQFTKHTNAWVPFVVASLALLKPGGRLAMVVPSEIIHITHARSLRSYLGRECSRIVIIDPEELWFADTLQGAVLLLAEKRRYKTQAREGLGIYPVKDREFLRVAPSKIFRAPQPINGKTVEGKWTRALLGSETRSLIDELAEHPDVYRFEEIADVDVGIVTGANKFFLVDDAVVNKYRLHKWAHPMFGRSEHCPGVIYDKRQHAANVVKGNPTNFLWFEKDAKSVDSLARAYIECGEHEKLHTRYKCRVRSPWYRVPSVYATEIGMLKRAHDTPRLILNQMEAYTTDTAYRVRVKAASAESFVGCFLNPLTALSAELEGRHYGGGVLELIPSEIEKLQIPLPKNVGIDLRELDRSARTLPASRLLAKNGAVVFRALQLSTSIQEQLLDAWHKLRDRRQRSSRQSL